jgi:son of sevenless-like protein
MDSPISATTPPKPSKRKNSKLKNELLKMDSTEVAQQLTFYEYRLYQKIRPSECINWAKTQKGETVANLMSFCATHDKLAAWVKMSVLSNDGLGKRADMIDYWIKVAEVSQSKVLGFMQKVCAARRALADVLN